MSDLETVPAEPTGSTEIPGATEIARPAEIAGPTQIDFPNEPVPEQPTPEAELAPVELLAADQAIVIAESVARLTTRARSVRSPCGERLIKLFDALVARHELGDALEFIRTHRVLDLSLAPGQIVAKVQDDVSRPKRVDIHLEQFSDELWDVIFRRLSESTLYVAKLLAGQFPESVEQAFADAGAELFPSSIDMLTISVDGIEVAPHERHVAAVLHKICDLAEHDPFAIFLLRGRGRDETLLELRKLRANARTAVAAQIAASPERGDAPAPPPIDLERFWNAEQEMFALPYSLRADELPAAILKRLDPMPLGELTDGVEHLLEESYARIAQRAQAFGFGLA